MDLGVLARAAVVAVACFALGLTLCGCSDDDESSSSSKGTTVNTTNTTQSDVTTASPTTAQLATSTSSTVWSNSQATGFSYLNPSCPLNSGVKIVDNNYQFCGMNFVKIADPQYLANWLALATREDDIFLATSPPSGKAKEPGLFLIKTLAGTTEISGHTEFYDWENDPTGANMPVGGGGGGRGGRRLSGFAGVTGRRLIGTHVPFEWLPTSVVQTPSGEQPRKVICLVREPKENFVHATLFNGQASDITSKAQLQVDAATGNGLGELGVGNRGFAAWQNGYAAAVGAENHGGPKVFLLSQSKLANSATVSAEVLRLAEFLEISPYTEDSATVNSAQSKATAALGDIAQMDSATQTLVDQTFVSPTVDPRIVALF